MNIAIVGGAFNPFHHGHFTIAKALINVGYAHLVMFMPTYKSQFGKALIDSSHRLEMIRGHLADFGMNSDSSVRVSDYEIRNKITGGTYDVLARMLEEDKKQKYSLYKGHKIYYVIGMDQANEIQRWKDWKKLLSLIPFLVINRKVDDIDIEPDSLWFLKEPHLFADIGESSDISSMQIRQMIKEGDLGMTRGMISDSAYYYIEENELYR